MRKNKVIIIIIIIAISVLLAGGGIFAIIFNSTKKPESEIGIKLSEDSIEVSIGEEHEIKLLDKDGNPLVAEWNTNQSSIATVSDGRITGVNQGETLIVAEYNGKNYVCSVKVNMTLNGLGRLVLENEIPDNGKYLFQLFVGQDYYITPSFYVGNKKIEDVQFLLTCDNEFVNLNNLTIKAIAPVHLVQVLISCEYNGENYKCIIEINAD